MAIEIKILKEEQIGIYSTPDVKTLQQVITYQTPGMAPRTLWVDTVKLPDTAWLLKNPAGKVPATVQAEADKVRRTLIEADVKRITAIGIARSI